MGVVFSKTQAPLLDFEYYTEWHKQQKRMKKSQLAKEYYQKNKDYIKAQHKEYLENSKAWHKRAEYMKEYQKKNKDCISQQQQEYYQKNKERYAKNYRERIKNGEAGGEKAECPLCKRWFVLTKSNQLHKHKCLP
tara:strand:+ start:75 stop:479 length:405 start_codon:yes stop_codon:yes gene_type:complete